MTILIGIDPGKRGCGVAVFEGFDSLAGQGAELIAAAYIAGSDEKRFHSIELARIVANRVVLWVGQYRSERPCKVAIEVPRVYPAGNQKGDQNDLIDVAMAAAACGNACATSQDELIGLYPRDWKGTVDADAMTNRIASRLTQAETDRILPCGSALLHNVYDAIGIGLHLTGRLAPKRVIPR